MLRWRLLRIAIAGVALVATSISATNATAAGVRYGQRTLRGGMHGADVRQLQRYLRMLALPTPQDGVYGLATASRVKLFERGQNQQPDGKVTPAEARLIRETATEATSAGNGGTPADNAPAPPGSAQTGVARISADGRTAIAPADAPPQVKAAIDAANRITNRPYRYGGGHGRFEDSAYDCSGTVSYALHGAGLISQPMDSTEFMSWGSAGRGRWMTLYSNEGHVFAVIAGLRLDTSAAGSGESGPRWRPKPRSASGFTARHMLGF
ncbi:MAG: hypothetical protein NVSMB25_13850 [Thermoleophilaceae bacterium]